jgi:small GTP-binding protein
MADEITLKIIILGDMMVGKTTFLLKYVDNFSPKLYISTAGIDYKIKKIKYNDIDITLQIWDTAGQERYKVITKSFVKGVDGIIFMYDITNKESFINIKKWIEDTEEYSFNTKKIIIGNKIDMEEKREVNDEMKEKLINEMNIDIMEVSAKNENDDINEVFDVLLKNIIGNLTKDNIFKKFARKYSQGSLSSQDIKTKHKRCC